ncbi:hypothetical protein J6590_062824 [Homalodisca vitripennis]|nr:hypothetical protein J6590_062824 [Homalodisca vitripennis]
MKLHANFQVYRKKLNLQSHEAFLKLKRILRETLGLSRGQIDEQGSKILSKRWQPVIYAFWVLRYSSAPLQSISLVDISYSDPEISQDSNCDRNVPTDRGPENPLITDKSLTYPVNPKI